MVSSFPFLPAFFSGEKMPDTIFRDPEKDTRAGFNGSGDLTSAGLVYNGQDFWIALEVKDRISDDINYRFHLRIFDKIGVRRVDITVRGGRIFAEKYAKNSIGFVGIIPFESAARRMVIQLPASLLTESAGKFMMNLDTLDPKTGERIDKTAWRVLEI